VSSVRMCDNCGTVFSEAVAGWQTGVIQTLDGEGRSVRRVNDRCPRCAVAITEGWAPPDVQLAGPPGSPPDMLLADPTVPRGTIKRVKERST
jgi:ribosomal protein S27AE